MTQTEFGTVMAYLSAGVGKAATLEQTRVYFDLLGDLPLPILQEAARRALMEHKYISLPPVGVIRGHAVSISGQRTLGPNAWELALAAVRRYGSLHETRGLATLPADVAEAVRAFGWRIICDATNEELGIVQTQFLKVYDTLGKRSEQTALMPPMTPACAALVESIEDSLPRLTSGTESGL